MATEQRWHWLAVCPRDLSYLLVAELGELGAEGRELRPGTVAFEGSRALMYRVCLWSRIATRVLLPVGEGSAADASELHASVMALPWPEVLHEDSSFVVDFSGTHGEIRNTSFGAQQCKDAIVDRCRRDGATGIRQDLKKPDVRISARLHNDRIDLALDMVGESLHRRGYRRGTGQAPLKENLAAALLRRAGWHDGAKEGWALLDPMCGSATFLLEAAFIAADHAPALGRSEFGFMSWKHHDPEQWRMIVADAKGRSQRGQERGLPELRGYDGDARVIRRAQENIAAAGMEKWVRVSVKSLREVKKPTHKPLPVGLVICNPPYGERLGDRDTLPALYASLGEVISREFEGWEAAILAPDLDIGRKLGLRSFRQHSFYNGRLPITLLRLKLTDNRFVDPLSGSEERGNRDANDQLDAGHMLDDGGRMFANRVRKNEKRLSSWVKHAGTDAYRIYDADMPEYAVAVDRYGDWLHVAEYAAPATVAAAAASARLEQVRLALPDAAQTPDDRIVFKQRERQRGTRQYERQGRSQREFSVREGEARLLVNLHDYLDTGLFLDHRPLRLMIGAEAKGKRFLNLFAYTGTATVHAALGGARQTMSVDLSNTYLSWLGRNLAHNGLSEARHRRERADVMEWLQGGDDLYDVILLDPPSFSNSKRTEATFDVQRDHVSLLREAMNRLSPQGKLYFSNNRRKFRLSSEISEHFVCEDITSRTIDKDFPRRPPPHQCWLLRHKGQPAKRG
ncbi:MAG: bifunctional 23S rRNA (guanine(2069)-N(7))-methyltransferase RlmK/23S rRNA (guanine(2445)-N(2))-methyltransferase RlmL [Pseudomonadota bacterium]